MCTGKGKPAVTLGIEADDKVEALKPEEELDGDDIRRYRALAARMNYISIDRPDVQFCLKDACREMSRPTVRALRKLERIESYLQGTSRLIWNYRWQIAIGTQDIFGDANWAQCKRTRKSTSGGTSMVGARCIKTWSKAQAIVAKSSAESELYGLVRASCEALGLQTLQEDLGRVVNSRVHIDSTAAKRIAERQGLDRVRHIDANVLWLQGQEVRKKLPLCKVLGSSNPADLMTTCLTEAQILTHLKLMGLEFRLGRAEAAAELYSIDHSNTIDANRHIPTQPHTTDQHKRCAEKVLKASNVNKLLRIADCDTRQAVKRNGCRVRGGEPADVEATHGTWSACSAGSWSSRTGMVKCIHEELRSYLNGLESGVAKGEKAMVIVDEQSNGNHSKKYLEDNLGIEMQNGVAIGDERIFQKNYVDGLKVLYEGESYSRGPEADDVRRGVCQRAGGHRGDLLHAGAGPRADHWRLRGQGGRWVRTHRTPRRALFTPYRVPRGPRLGSIASLTRVTRGTYVDGEAFELVDRWQDIECSHRLLDREWTGETGFVEGAGSEIDGKDAHACEGQVGCEQGKHIVHGNT